jgi:hypothetical protein
MEPFEPPPVGVHVAGGRDGFQDFATGVPAPGEGAHAPINFHAIAAATGGSFHPCAAGMDAATRHVLVLANRHGWRAAAAAARWRREGRSVIAGWKECGAHQLARQLRRPLAGWHFTRLLRHCCACWAASPAALAWFSREHPDVARVELPTPYPVDVPGWDFSRPLSQRAGLLVGTREWGVAERRHGEAARLALALARECRTRLTLVAGPRDLAQARAFAATRPDLVVVVEGPLPYPDYLRLMASHRVVLQRDASGVPGQAAGDALLTRLPCLGGGGMVDGIAFAELPGAADDERTVAEATRVLLTDDQAWHAAVDASQQRALASLSFGAFRRRWAARAAELGTPAR